MGFLEIFFLVLDLLLKYPGHSGRLVSRSQENGLVQEVRRESVERHMPTLEDFIAFEGSELPFPVDRDDDVQVEDKSFYLNTISPEDYSHTN